MSIQTSNELAKDIPYVKLASGHNMPLLAFGTWGGGDEHDTVAAAAGIALNAGYSHIDAAQFYKNESHIGEFIASHLNEGKRKRSDLFITTKVWNTNHHPEHVRPSVVKSIGDLKCEYLDLLLIHWPVAWEHSGLDYSKGPAVDESGAPILASVPLIDTWRAMEKLVDEGLVRSIGVSNFTAPLLHDLRIQARIPISVNQVELHPYLSQVNLIKYCEKFNIHVSAFSPLGRPYRTFDASVIHDPYIAEIVKKYSTSANEFSPAAVLLAWGIKRGTSVLPKSSTPHRIVSNLTQTIQMLKVITDEDLAIVSSLNRNYRSVNLDYLTGKFQMAGVSLFE